MDIPIVFSEIKESQMNIVCFYFDCLKVSSYWLLRDFLLSSRLVSAVWMERFDDF